MPRQYEDDEFDLDDNGTMSEVRKALRAAEKRVKELESENQTLRKTERKFKVTESIAKRGLNPKIAAVVPSDIEPDAIDSWLEEYADIFGTATASEPDKVDEPVDQVPPEAARYADLAAQGRPANGDEADLLQRILNAETPEALNEIIFGNKMGPPLM